MYFVSLIYNYWFTNRETSTADNLMVTMDEYIQRINQYFTNMDQCFFYKSARRCTRLHTKKKNANSKCKHE